MAVKIVTDSTADLPSDIVSELGITVVPANVRFGNDDYKDGVDLSADEFFDKLLNGPDFPTTSQPSIGEFQGPAYERIAAQDGVDGIVSVHVSGKLSGTMNSATQGANQAAVDCPIEVLDTRQASMGSGLAAIAAARAAQGGAGAEETADAARSAIARSQCFALLDTLEYLIKGGRIGKARGAIGKLLRIKPMIILRDGEVNDLAKERTHVRAIARLRRTAEEYAPARRRRRHVQHRPGRSPRPGERPRPPDVGRRGRPHNGALRTGARDLRGTEFARHNPAERGVIAGGGQIPSPFMGEG